MPPDGKTQQKLKEYEAPRWGYRRQADGTIESDVFDTYLPHGWADSPANVDVVEIAVEAPAEQSEISSPNTPEVKGEPENTRETEPPLWLDPDWREMAWPEMRAHFFDVTGVRPASKVEAEAMATEYGDPAPAPDAA